MPRVHYGPGGRAVPRRERTLSVGRAPGVTSGWEERRAAGSTWPCSSHSCHFPGKHSEMVGESEGGEELLNVCGQGRRHGIAPEEGGGGGAGSRENGVKGPTCTRWP